MGQEVQGWNLFELLGLDDLNPTKVKIDQQWRQLRAFYQSESFRQASGMSPQEIEKLLGALDEAYRILSQPELRQRYVRKYERELQAWEARQKWRKPELPLFYESDPEMEQWIQNQTHWTGAHLRRVREYKNVSLERLAFYTKIKPIYLQAIEDMAFSLLPSLVFVKGYVKEYARALKLDVEKVLNSYLAYYDAWQKQSCKYSGRNPARVALWG